MRHPIRLGLFIDIFQPGGTQRQFLELLRGLDRARFVPHVACFHADGAWFDAVRQLEAPVETFPIRGFARPGTFRAAAAFAAWCRRHRLDVVHTWDIYSNIFGLPVAALARVPVRIGSRRGLNPDRTAAQRRAQRLAYAAAHAVVANSRAAAEQLEREGVPAARISVRYNGIDLNQFPPRSYRSTIRRIVMVAGLRPIKGLDVLVTVAARIARAAPDLRFTIVGDGPARVPALEQARALGVGDRFEFLGHRDDVATLLRDADAMVLPSRSEAFPNAVLEAMASGLPVVASAVGGIVELVEADRTGLLVPADNPSELAAAILELVRNPARAAAMGSAGRTSVEQRYSSGSMVSSFEQLYAGLFPFVAHNGHTGRILGNTEASHRRSSAEHRLHR